MTNPFRWIRSSIQKRERTKRIGTPVISHTCTHTHKHKHTHTHTHTHTELLHIGKSAWGVHGQSKPQKNVILFLLTLRLHTHNVGRGCCGGHAADNFSPAVQADTISRLTVDGAGPPVGVYTKNPSPVHQLQQTNRQRGGQEAQQEDEAKWQ